MNRTLGAKIDDANRTLTGKTDETNRLLAVSMGSLKDEIASAKIWALVLYFTLAAAMFGTMARGFGWL